MFRFLKRIGRRLGLVKAEASPKIFDFEDDDWLRKMLEDLGPSIMPEPLIIAWAAPVGSHSFAGAYPPLNADQRLQFAAEHFAAVVIDALQHG